MAYRSQRRHHEIQGRSVADRRRDCDHRQVGGRRCACRAIPADMPAPRQFSDLDAWYIGKPDIVVDDGASRTCCRRPGRTTSSTCWSIRSFKEDMYVMAIESKPADPRSFKVVHHFTTNLVEDRGRRSDRPVPERVRARQERRHLSAELGPPDQGRDEDQLQPAPEPARRRDTGQREARIEGVPEGRRCRSTSPSRSTWATRRSSTFRPVRSRGTTATSGCRVRRWSRRSSRTCTIAARRCAWKRSIPDVRADSARPGPSRVETLSCVSNYQFGWHITYPYADDVAPLLPAGTIVHITGVARQHRQQPLESESEELGRRRRAVDRRNELRLGDHHLPRRRRLPAARSGRTRARERQKPAANQQQ